MSIRTAERSEPVPSRWAPCRVRGVIRCPECGASALWLAHTAERAFVIALSELEARLFVRELSAQPTHRAATHRLLLDLARTLGAELWKVRIEPDGLGGVRAELEVFQGPVPTRVPAPLLDAVAIAKRLQIPVLVPEGLLVDHAGRPTPSCPEEDAGLPAAPPAFLEFLERLSADAFRPR
jgi:bifunctional DNase/RNase